MVHALRQPPHVRAASAALPRGPASRAATALEAGVDSRHRAGLADGSGEPVPGPQGFLSRVDFRPPAASPSSAARIADAPRAIASPCRARSSSSRSSADSPARRRAPPISRPRGAGPRAVVRPRPARARRRSMPTGSRATARPRETCRREGCRGRRMHRAARAARLVEQARLLVLAVDLDDRPHRLGEPRRRDRLVVDPGGGPAARAHFAGRDQWLRQPIEQGLHARGVCPVAHQRRVRARAERQTQRVDEQALPAPVSPVSTFSPGSSSSRRRREVKSRASGSSSPLDRWYRT